MRNCCDAPRILPATFSTSSIDSKRRSEIHSRPLLELSLILLVNKKHHLVSAKQLWSRDKIEETLITFPRGDTVQTHFQRGLERFGVEWFAGIEVNSTRLIEHYVVNDYGIGVTVATPLSNLRPECGLSHYQAFHWSLLEQPGPGNCPR